MKEGTGDRLEEQRTILELTRIYYDNLGKYIDKIFNFTHFIIQQDEEEENKILSMQIWLAIANEEDYRINVANQIKKPSYGFLQKYHFHLSKLCIQFIVTDDYYNNKLSISTESFFLLFVMSRTCENDFLNNMIDYVTSSKNNNTLDKKEYAGLKVFHAIVHTIHKEEFYPKLKEFLFWIAEILIENSILYY